MKMYVNLSSISKSVKVQLYVWYAAEVSWL